jgi:outer membrane immunogenic protein
MVRHIVLTTVSAVALTVSASAADIYAQAGGKDEPFVPVAAWTGFYMGANGGYAFDALSSHGGVQDDGGFGGFQIGYNVQGAIGLSRNLVLGIESDFEGAGIDNSGIATIHWDNGTTSTAPHRRSIDDFGTVRGRIGYAFDRTLFYFTGGFAYGSLKNSFDVSGTIYRGNAIETGYVLGGGAEYKISPAWSVKAEYQFIDLGNSDATNGLGSFIRTKDTELNTVRAGVNYHFNSPFDPLPEVAAIGGYKDASVPVGAWAGLYTGVNGGYAWGTGNELTGTADVTSCARFGCTTTPYSANAHFTADGGFGGGQVGYNWQRERLVYGVEADIQGADASGSAAVTPFAGTSALASTSLDWFGTVRGRLGYAAFDRALLYVTGGFAYGGVEERLTLTGSLHATPAEASQVATGYVVGGGIEYAFSPAWSVKAEYQFIDLGTEALSATILVGRHDSSTGVVDAHDAFNTVRLGLNYHVTPAYEPLK